MHKLQKQNCPQRTHWFNPRCWWNYKRVQRFLYNHIIAKIYYLGQLYSQYWGLSGEILGCLRYLIKRNCQNIIKSLLVIYIWFVECPLELISLEVCSNNLILRRVSVSELWYVYFKLSSRFNFAYSIWLSLPRIIRILINYVHLYPIKRKWWIWVTKLSYEFSLSF